MGIKTKLKLIGLLPVLMAVSFGLIAYQGQGRLSDMRGQTTLAGEMLDKVWQLESATHRFVETRGANFRPLVYALFDVLDSQMQQLSQDSLKPSADTGLTDLRARLARAHGDFVKLDRLYRGALQAFDMAQTLPVAERLRTELGEIKPFLSRLHWGNQQALADYSDRLARTQFILIGLTTLLILMLAYPVLSRINTALDVLSRGAKELGACDPPPVLTLPGQDEFSQLARDFNQMTERLATAEAARTQHLRELENAVKDLENFSYSVSHDLRSPLRAIDGFVAILLDEYAPQLDAEGLRLFGVVQDNAKKMEQLIDDILALSRAGRFELQTSRVDMNDLVDAVWSDLSESLGERSVQFRRADLPSIVGDARALRQVWQNLLDNALKFTQGREPALIEVSAEPLDGMIRYSVKDNGAGFDPAYANKLFGLFLRLHGTDEFAGTGVGLAITKRFIQKHDGRVEAIGAVDAGATFSFSLPLQPSIASGGQHDHERHSC